MAKVSGSSAGGTPNHVEKICEFRLEKTTGKYQRSNGADCPNLVPNGAASHKTFNPQYASPQRYRQYCESDKHIRKLTLVIEALDLANAPISLTRRGTIGGSCNKPAEVGAATPSLGFTRSEPGTPRSCFRCEACGRFMGIDTDMHFCQWCKKPLHSTANCILKHIQEYHSEETLPAQLPVSDLPRDDWLL